MMRRMTRGLVVAIVCGASMRLALAQGQVVKVTVRSGPPNWSKGILPIGRDSYYSAMECGKQGGDNPACVFWDTGFCKNPEFELTFYTGYKSVAYAVWDAVHQQKPAPTPDYAEAQRTRVTVAVKPLRPKDNAVVDAYVKRDKKASTNRNSSACAESGVRSRFSPAICPISPFVGMILRPRRSVRDRAVAATLAPSSSRSD